MGSSSTSNGWSLESAISILRSATRDTDEKVQEPPVGYSPPTPLPIPQKRAQGGLGDFSAVWNLLGLPDNEQSRQNASGEKKDDLRAELSPDAEFAQLVKGVKWRDEYDGADLEDNVEPQPVAGPNLRTRKRAARRARARERELKAMGEINGAESDTLTDTDDESNEELEALRKSPDRRAVIASLLGRPRPVEITPPTSPSPPKENNILRTPKRKEYPVSQPFLWSAPAVASPAPKSTITPIDGLTPRLRKQFLVRDLGRRYPEEDRYLKNTGLLEPAFCPLNTSPIGIHVFIDMSNISIGFHDCLKVARGIPISTRTRRIPMNFHNLSLVLERGRPAAKRILSGSDRTSVIEQAEACGYETNILDRVHKVKTPTPKARKYTPNRHGGGYNSASNVSHGETSGSETPGYPYSQPTYKWSEQAVDEILHLKMSHSILDADKPSTIVLATGDAAEAEYSDGFLRMVERALNKGWMVELVSFKLNTSSLYRRHDFRNKWGRQFKWIQLDDFVESLFDVESD